MSDTTTQDRDALERGLLRAAPRGAVRMSSWRLAQELVRRFGTPPPQDTDGGNWYPGAWWLAHADELLALIDAACTAAAPPAEPPRASGGSLVMPRINGQPFRCLCGNNVFRCSGDIYTCTACMAQYVGEAMKPRGDDAVPPQG